MRRKNHEEQNLIVALRHLRTWQFVADRPFSVFWRFNCVRLASFFLFFFRLCKIWQNIVAKIPHPTHWRKRENVPHGYTTAFFFFSSHLYFICFAFVVVWSGVSRRDLAECHQERDAQRTFHRVDRGARAHPGLLVLHRRLYFLQRWLHPGSGSHSQHNTKWR